MKVSDVLTPAGMEMVVSGCGVLTVGMSAKQDHSLILQAVFILTALTQYRVQGTGFGPKTSFRRQDNTGLLLGNLLIPMVTASSWTGQGGPSPSGIHLVPALVLSVGTALGVLVGSLSGLTIGAEYRFADRLLILPAFGLQVWSLWLEHPWGWIVTVTSVLLSVKFFCTELLFFLPGSFTLGEVVLVSQAFASLTLVAAHSLVHGTGKLLACLQVLVLGFLVIGLMVYPVVRCIQSHQGQMATEDSKRFHLRMSLSFYLCLAGAVFVVLWPWLWVLLGQEPLQWGIQFVLDSRTRVLLLCLWVVMVTVAVGVVVLFGSSSTVVRKYFHLVAIGVFVPGILHDVQLLHLAASGTIFIFVILEFLRIFRIWPLGDVLHNAFKVFLDDQDSGTAILTHIYLLLGMALPVWIYAETVGVSESGLSLAIYSGVLSLGVGDTAASVFGSLYGKHRWPGSKKTVEGTCAAVVSQSLACCLLYCLDPRLSPRTGWAAVGWAVLLTSLLEAATVQIDNLVLPLFMYSLLLSFS